MLTMPVESSEPMLGRADAPVTLVEYGDYECVHTARAQPVVRELMSRFRDEARLVFRYFPLRKIHPYSWEAAQAAEAASRQGKFWEMHEFLLSRWDSLDRDQVVAQAAELGLNVGRFEREMISQEVLDRVHEHRTGGVLSGVSQTPTFFVNGEMLEGQWSLEALSAAVRNALSKDKRSRPGAA